VGLLALTISEVLGKGEILKLTDGRILKVDQFDQISAQMIVPPTDGLLLDSGDLVIVDQGDILKVEALNK